MSGYYSNRASISAIQAIACHYSPFLQYVSSGCVIFLRTGSSPTFPDFASPCETSTHIRVGGFVFYQEKEAGLNLRVECSYLWSWECSDLWTWCCWDLLDMWVCSALLGMWACSDLRTWECSYRFFEHGNVVIFEHGNVVIFGHGECSDLLHMWVLWSDRHVGTVDFWTCGIASRVAMNLIHL